MEFIQDMGAYLLGIFVSVWHLVESHPVAFAVIMIVMIALVTIAVILDEGGRQIHNATQFLHETDEEDNS